MFNAEVLSKFPVVQHFPFGSLFSWNIDPNASTPQQSIHMANQPVATAATAATPVPSQPEGTAAPWAQATRMPGSSSQAAATAAPWSQATRMPGPGGPGKPYSRVPDREERTTIQARGAQENAKSGLPQDLVPSLDSVRPTGPRGTAGAQVSVTKAPWAR